MCESQIITMGNIRREEPIQQKTRTLSKKKNDETALEGHTMTNKV